jgi:hypothetical protein
MTEYLAGLLTIPAVIAAGWLVRHLFDKNRGIECDNCDRSFGEPGVNYKQATLMRWRYHYIRYRGWAGWTCRKAADG